MMMRSGKRARLCACLCVIGARASVLGAMLEAVDDGGVVTLSNQHVAITFRSATNMVPASVRRAAPESQELIDLFIISYLTGESTGWYQDNKRGKEGFRNFTYEVIRDEHEVRLVVRHPSEQPDDPHFSHTKTIVLRRDAPFVQLDYELVCVREGELKSDISMPNVWFAEGLTHAAYIGPRRTLFAGPVRELSERDVRGRWYGAFDPDTNEGLLVAFVAEPEHAVASGWSRDRNSVRAIAPQRSLPGLKPGVRIHNTFLLMPFHVADPAKELPALAAEVLAQHGVPVLRPQRSRVSRPGVEFDFDDLSLWERHRTSVAHPAATIKAADIANAKANIERFDWARRLVEGLERGVRSLLDKDRTYFENMIPATTPCCQLFTMCPACEAYPMHGLYDWSPGDPDKLVCRGCKTVYPNPEYPEDEVYITKWGGGQKLTAYKGKSWSFNPRHTLTSTFLGNIRARKVAHMAGLVRRAALVYALTDDVRYAEQVKAILLRFAEVYPNYLVHTGYNEFADMDPKIAAARISDLPADEITFGPNKPDRKLFPGYWMAGRATGVGMEGNFLTQVAEAYDLTCTALRGDGTPVYSEQERLTIEKDLIIEATYLLLHDPKINNKTATNRRGVGVAGIVLGDPMRVRFGMEGFLHFVDDWFLFDGTTSESTSYGYMTLGGIFPIGQALHGYSDPPEFTYRGQRFDRFDVYGLPRYRAVFRALYETLLPDLTYPVLADQSHGSGISTRWAEVMFSNYLDNDYLGILQRRYGGNVEQKGDEYALLHRPADADVSTPMDFELRSVFFPALKVGYLRGGAKDRETTLVLSASDWGIHHHLDSLGIVYHVGARECLTDLGYLWDSPDSRMTRRTFAHNTLVVDETDQISRGRLGHLHLFDDSGWVKVIEASTNAYSQCSQYRRTCLMVDHAEAGAYVVDLFRVAGGRVHDLVFHGPNEPVTVEPAPEITEGLTLYDLKDVKRVEAATWRARWVMPDGLRFDLHSVAQPDESAWVGTGWGQRSHRETPGAAIPYVVRRRTGQDTSLFVSVFEAHPRDSGLVQSIARLPAAGPQVACVRIERAEGTDYVVSNPDGGSFEFHDQGRHIHGDARAAVVSFSNAVVTRAYMFGGSRIECNNVLLTTGGQSASGDAIETANEGLDSWLVVRSSDLPEGDLNGKWLVVHDGECTTGYPIEHIERSETETKLFTKRRGKGFAIDAADHWHMWHAVSITK